MRPYIIGYSITCILFLGHLYILKEITLGDIQLLSLPFIIVGLVLFGIEKLYKEK